MKRVFIAVKINAAPELLKVISSLKTMLAKEDIKWIDPVNIHITLAFLGDTEEKKIRVLTNMLSKICSDFPKFKFSLSGTGIFKSLREPRVLWAGISQSEKLAELNKLLANELRENGFAVDERPFKPHLTLGRMRSVKDAENLRIVMNKIGKDEIQEVRVDEVILFESILMNPSPLYKPLGKFECQKPFIK